MGDGINNAFRSQIIEKDESQRRTVGIAALAAGVVCWGVTPVLIRRLTAFVDAWTANGLRYPVSAVLYWPVLWRMWNANQLHWTLIRRCLVPAFLSTAGQIFWSLAHYQLQASEIGFFARMSTAWAILGSVVLFHDERQLLARPRFLVGLAVIALGFLVMSWLPTTSNSPTSTTRPLAEQAEAAADTSDMQPHRLPAGNYTVGVTFALLASCFFGTYMVSIRWYVPTENPIHVFAVVGQFVSIGMIVGMFWCGDASALGQQTLFSWSLIVGSSIMGIGVGHVLVYTAVQRLGASITTSCQSVLPFVTVAVAAIVLSERLIPQQWMGGIMMIAGALLLLSMKHEISHSRPSPSAAKSS